MKKCILLLLILISPMVLNSYFPTDINNDMSPEDKDNVINTNFDRILAEMKKLDRNTQLLKKDVEKGKLPTNIDAFSVWLKTTETQTESNLQDAINGLSDAIGSVSVGNGTVNYIPKWLTTTTLTDSVIFNGTTNIGIGTSNPTSSLHVNGDFQVKNVAFDVWSTSSTLVFPANNFLEMRGSDLRLKYAYNQPALYIFDQGLTATKFISLFVSSTYGKILANSLSLWLAPTTKLIYIQNTLCAYDSNGFGGQDDGGNIGWWIRDGGNVGIGTTQPVTKLHINGTMYAVGNVGIGSANPQANLDVAGTVQIRTGELDLGGSQILTTITQPIWVSSSIYASNAGLFGGAASDAYLSTDSAKCNNLQVVNASTLNTGTISGAFTGTGSIDLVSGEFDNLTASTLLKVDSIDNNSVANKLNIAHTYVGVPYLDMTSSCTINDIEINDNAIWNTNKTGSITCVQSGDAEFQVWNNVGFNNDLIFNTNANAVNIVDTNGTRYYTRMYVQSLGYVGQEIVYDINVSLADSSSTTIDPDSIGDIKYLNVAVQNNTSSNWKFEQWSTSFTVTNNTGATIKFNWMATGSP